MLKTAIKSSLKEVEGVFRLFNSRKDLFMNHLSGPKGPQFPESANLFHDHRFISINYKTIQISTSPPKKNTTSRHPICSGPSPFCLSLFFWFTAQRIIKQTNQQHHLKAPRPPSPNTLVFHDCIATHRHDDLDTFVTSVTLESSRRPLKKKHGFSRKRRSFELRNLNHPKLGTIIVIVFGFQSV